MRTKGSGSITERATKNGKSLYYPVINARDPETNKRTRRWGKGHRSKIHAQAELTKMLAEGNEYTPTRGLTLGQLVDQYIASREQIGKQPTTVEGYEVHRRRLDGIEKTPVERLTPKAVEAFYGRLMKREERPLSSTTVAHTHDLIRASFKWALRKGIVNRNPMDRVEAPTRRESTGDALQLKVVALFLNEIKGHRLEAPMLFSLGTGARRGEIAGLRLPALDMDRGVVIIRESRAKAKRQIFQKVLKTEDVREIPLGDTALTALKIARVQRAQHKLKAGSLWEGSDFVFTDELGRPLDPNAITDAFRRSFKALEKRGFGHKRLHDLRHTAATIMLASGMDLNTVQEILGHSVAATTLDMYGHVLEGRKREGIGSIDHALKHGKTSQNASKRRARRVEDG